MTFHAGTVPASTTLYVPFTTYAGSTGASATCTGLAVTDVEIYKNGSTTQRSSDAGIALLDTDGIDFDAITGLHGFSIDLSDNTDSGFYAVGSWYWVVVSAITVDSQTVTFLAATFRIGPAESITGHPKTDVGGWLGTAPATPTVAGVPEVDITHLLGTAWLSPAVAGTPDVNVHLIKSQTLTAAAGITFGVYVGGAAACALSTGVNVTALGGSSQSATDLKDFVDTGYDPVTHKVAGVVLADTTTTLTNLPAITSNWLTAAGLASDAVAEIQSGLATPTNITAGTITTVTNLTNAPTSGDLTATMKASVNTEIDTALADIHLDHLLAVDYDPASKPGTATALLNELIGSDAGVSQFTANALELAPTGGSAPTASQIADEVQTRTIAAVTTVTTTTNLTNLPAITANWLTAAGLAADAVTEIQSGLAIQTSVDDLPTNAELATAITVGLTTALTEGYRSTGATGSVRDILYELLQNMTEFANSGTTKTVKKLDGSTTAKTYTYDDATTPTSLSETT